MAFFVKRIIKPDAKTILAALVFVQLCSYFNGELMNRSAAPEATKKCATDKITQTKKKRPQWILNPTTLHLRASNSLR